MDRPLLLLLTYTAGTQRLRFWWLSLPRSGHVNILGLLPSSGLVKADVAVGVRIAFGTIDIFCSSHINWDVIVCPQWLAPLEGWNRFPAIPPFLDSSDTRTHVLSPVSPLRVL